MVKGKEVNYPSNDDVLGGIKAAIERGETLKDSMMTFLNAGYSKEEIQEAARNYLMEKSEITAMNNSQLNQKAPIAKPVVQTPKEPEKKQEIKPEQKQTPISPEEHKPFPVKKIISRPIKKFSSQKKNLSQKVSNYENKPKKRVEPITIILILLLFFLILVLGAVFLFKSQLVEFFNKFFS